MHGVKKSPASEAQLQQRKLERDAKLEAFVQARNMIFKKREKNELDQELLVLTAEVLKKNPDIYTFWNIRRQILELTTKRDEEQTDEQHLENLTTVFDAELKLSYKAIEANPKSYSAWYQRGWILQRHPKPDLKAELELCEKTLSFHDCRNFHCWDHRRVVAKLAGLDEQEELEFSDRLIKLNPSNYSAWHYRGTLMKRMQDKDVKYVLDDKMVAKELETVKNVCAYNSEDQTAWTYCRWLCEAVCTKVDTTPVLVCAKVIDSNSVHLTFSRALTAANVEEFIQFGSNDYELEKISSLGTPNHKFVMVHRWLLKTKNGNLKDLKVLLGDDYVNVRTEQPLLNADYLKKFYSFESKCESNDAKQALAGVVEMCEGLMQEEEDIPWEVLMLARMLPLLNGYNTETIDRCTELLQKTSELDSQRKNVYSEISKRLQLVREFAAKDINELYEFFCISNCLK